MDERASTIVYSDDNMDASTAPTTPDGSLMSSPTLHALRIQDAFDGAIQGHPSRRQGSESLESALDSSNITVKNVCCIGAGYVGGPTAAVMAYQNPHLRIAVVDRDAKRIAQWNSKHLPLYEPGLYEILRIARDGSKAFSFPNRPDEWESGSAKFEIQCLNREDEIHVPARPPNLFFSTEIARSIREADIILIAVNTPTKKHGLGAGRATDVTALEAVTREIAIHAKPGAILVEKSTVPCRTADIIKDTLAAHRPNTPFTILSNPEFLSAGTAITDLLHPSRVLIGSPPTPTGHHAASLLASIYSWIPPSKILHTNTYSSELAKLVANAMLAQRISSINSISAICERTGASIQEISLAVGADARIGGKYLQAGVGFGGSCFGKDIRSLIYLAEGLGLPEVGEYWEGVLKINEWQRERFVKRVVRELNGTLVGKKIAVLGYAFKKGTDDMRESPALESIKMLLDEAPREIAVWDPFCEKGIVEREIGRMCGEQSLRGGGGPVEVCGNVYLACEDADAVVIMTDCDEFRSSSEQPARKDREDPRPFQSLEPNESDLLQLQQYLSATTQDPDPLGRYMPEPECEQDCKTCAVEQEKSVRVRKERLDWAKIAYHLRKPKWIFDGRNVLDVPEMEKLGCRIESIGRVGWGGV